jgi:hypothetical protein
MRSQSKLLVEWRFHGQAPTASNVVNANTVIGFENNILKTSIQIKCPLPDNSSQVGP